MHYSFGNLAKKYETSSLIKICIAAYAGIASVAIQLDKQSEFVDTGKYIGGCFQGAIQALSRSYFAKIIPPEKAGEFFGIFDICGKGAAFMGTALMGVFAQVTGQCKRGRLSLAIMFVIGFFVFVKAVKKQKSSIIL